VSLRTPASTESTPPDDAEEVSVPVTTPIAPI
jgi:hypothetical protein